MGVEQLATLIPRISMMGVPCRVNDAAGQIEEAVDSWALGTGIVTGPREVAKLRAARFGWLVARLFSEASVDEVVLPGKWYAWFFLLDDIFDGGDGASPETVEEVYSDVFAALSRRTAVTPVGVAFAELWSETKSRLGPDWQERFVWHLRQHQQASITQASNRLSRRIPSLREYVGLRRDSNAPFLFDLPEAILGTEIPRRLTETPEWLTLTDGSNDITAWCNDVASLAKEQACGDTHNYIMAIAHAEAVSIEEATVCVLDRIVWRCAEVRAAAVEFPDLCSRFGMDRASVSYACRVAVAYLAVPRAHIDWLLTSSRYTDDFQ